MTPVTDPALLAQLGGSAGNNSPQGLTPVTDPDMLKQLNSTPSLAADVAKGAGKGIAEGVTGLAGLPGDTEQGVDKLLHAVLPSNNTVRGWFGAAPLNTPDQLPKPAMPTSDQINSTTGVDQLPSPQTNAGKYAESVGSFVPSAAAGPESVAKNLLMRAAIPGVASEGLGQLTEGTAAEPYARVAGALLAPSGEAKAVEAPAASDLLADGGAGRNAYRSQPFAVRSGVMSNWANNQLNNFATDQRGFRAANTPQTTALLKEVAASPQVHWADDLDSLQDRFNDLSKGLDGRDATAAASAKRSLEDQMGSFTQNQTLLGDPAAAAQTWNDAQSNYAAGMRGQTIDNAVDNATGTAAKNNSGLNVGNDIRGAINPLTKDQNKLARTSGYNQDEIDAMRNITRGTIGSNLLRYGGNVLGGGGGLGGLAMGGAIGAAGTAADGPAGALAGPAAMLGGLALRHGYNAMQLKRVKALSNMVRARSPLGGAAAAPQGMSPVAQKLLALHQALTGTQ